MLTVDYERLVVEDDHKVLDLGCGFGRHAYESLRRGATVTACDMALPELQEVRATYAAMLQAGEIPDSAIVFACAGDATQLPFNDGSFDRIIASEVLEHIHDDDCALQELFRVLKPGGKIAITIPAYLPEKVCWVLSDEYHAPKEIGGHVRIYRKNELKGKMQSHGLEPIDYHRAHALHSPYWWLKCAVGPKNSDHPLVKTYLRFLTWDIVKQPWITKILEKLLQPVLGKSAIIYAQKAATA